MTNPRVKPLVWQDWDGGMTVAATPWGKYNLNSDLRLSLPTGAYRRYETEQSAKAAAQADYEARILSALDLTPAPAVQALDNKEQLDIWAQEILEGLAFADVLKIESYEDKIEAHSVIGRGIVEVLRALAAFDKTD